MANGDGTILAAVRSISTTQIDGGTRRLTVYYVSALSVVAILTIAGQFLVQSQLSRQLNDSKVVNLAGRQRMLGQRLCKCAALLTGDAANNADSRYLEELQATLPIWRRSHLGMQAGDAELGLPGDNSPAVTSLFTQVNPTFDVMYSAAERMATTFTAPGSTKSQAVLDAEHDMSVVLAHEASYLHGMDRIVSQYEAESQRRVAQLKAVERILLGLTLGVLLLEGLFVFRPAARRIREAFAALRCSGDDLRRAKDAAESANAAKTKFLAHMSHELRTPLHAVLGATELLRNANPSLAHGDYLEVVEDSSHTLLCLLNDLLDLSRIETGKMELHPTTFDLREFLGRTTSMFQAAAQAKGVELRSRMAEDLPLVVVFDQLRLRQVLANLLNNALKFTEAGTVTLRVSTPDTDERRTSIRFEVVDTGIGIPLAEQARIFESFTQLNSAADMSRGGVGLGLAICSHLVALMGGRLEVQSEPGRGSKFSFAIACGTDDVIGSSPAAATTASPAAISSLRILAADDAPAGRRILEALLEADGHRTLCVADGREVVAAFAGEPFDLVLLDLRMPEVDGVTAAAAIRRYEREHGRLRTPIVAVTADAMRPPPATSAFFDFDDYITKPFSGDVLRRTIRRCARPPVDAEPAMNDASLATETRTVRILARLQGRRALLDELVELFLNDAPRLFDEFQLAWNRRDLCRLKTAIHRFRGQLEMFEVRQAARVALQIEQACEQAEESRIAENLAMLTDSRPAILDQVGALRSMRLHN